MDNQLGDRIARLNRAILRINATLELDAVLQAVMDGARSLTNAPYALITTIDGDGQVEDYQALGLDAVLVSQL